MADFPAVMSLLDGAVAWLVANGRSEQWGTDPFTKRQPVIDRLGGESDHQCRWEGPGLRGVIADPFNGQTGFLGDLPPDAVFQRLTGLDKARQYRMPAGRPAGLARQQQTVAM